LRRLTATIALVLLLVAPPANAVTISTQNVRRTLPPLEARHDLRQAARGSTIVVAQELFARRAPWLAPPGWGTAHRRGPRGDCATFWDRSVWRARRSYPVQLTDADFPGGHGHRWALVTILHRPDRTIAVVCVHMITHARARPIVYRAGIRRLRQLAVNLAQRFPVIIGGDWNVPHPWDVRTKLRGFPVAAFPGWQSRATVRRTTRESRPDWFLWTGFRSTSIARISRTYSDHDGVRIRLR
jgi:hypothetical protein